MHSVKGSLDNETWQVHYGKKIDRVIDLYNNCPAKLRYGKIPGPYKTGFYEKSIKEKTLYDLVYLDILMPEIDGLDTLKKIRELEQTHNIPESLRCKVIMTTTVSQISKTMKAFHYGCSAYLVKPIDKNELYREIKKIPFGKSLNIKWRGL